MLAPTPCARSTGRRRPGAAYTIIEHTMICYTILYYAMLCYTIKYYALLCYTIICTVYCNV